MESKISRRINQSTKRNTTMKKHSPNFIENEREAFEAKNNRAATFFWTVVLITTLMLGLSVTKTKAQDSSVLKRFIYSDTSRYLIGTLMDHGVNIQIRTADTIPVVMMVSDTTHSGQQRQMFSLNDIDTVKISGGYFAFPQFKNAYIFEISTPMHYQPYIIYGYGVTEKVMSGDAVNTLRFQYYKTTYLNHKKQPLPDRIIVWMAIRRN